MEKTVGAQTDPLALQGRNKCTWIGKMLLLQQCYSNISMLQQVKKMKEKVIRNFLEKVIRKDLLTAQVNMWQLSFNAVIVKIGLSGKSLER